MVEMYKGLGISLTNLATISFRRTQFNEVNLYRLFIPKLCDSDMQGVRGEVGPVLFLNWTPRHAGILGSAGRDPRILDLGTRMR
jgi:hypothetical protein